MNPIKFPEQNVTIAEDQPEYLPLPAFLQDGMCVTCWRLTWWERLKMLITGRLWLTVLTFGTALQPLSPSLDCPFEKADPGEWTGTQGPGLDIMGRAVNRPEYP